MIVKKIFTFARTSAAIGGTCAVIVGTASCFVGITGTGAVRLGELLNPSRQTLKAMIFYGSESVGVGFFSTFWALFIAKAIDVSLKEEEVESTNICAGCRNFHGGVYNGVRLICGIHPYGCEDNHCPDCPSAC